MPRKCCTIYDGKACQSKYDGNDFQGIVFTFPSGKSEASKKQREEWIKALPNLLDETSVTQHMGICERHWKPGYEFKVVQGGVKKPIHPPTEFGATPSSFKQQSTTSSNARNVTNSFLAKNGEYHRKLRE